MSGAPVLVETADAVGTITLNRADKRNALDSTTIDGIRIALAELELEPEVRVIVLRGDGPDFCAGADLAQLERIAVGADSIENLSDARQLGDLFVRMRRGT
ncbi:MAG: enoyl-CoA hydratase/isomerase family protein, partial [Gemmatimonadetes bacterium]|nr:enoyl-CoA hydratase/isomerase family protein [Gemmatimonadota bacterium]